MSDGSATVIETPPGTPDAVIVELPDGSVSGDPAVEPVADAAVEIARIEADRDVTIAAIHSETEQAHIEARAENEGDLWQNMNRLSDEMSEMRGQLTGIAQTLLTLSPPLSSPPISVVEEPIAPPPTIETAEEPPSTPIFTSPETDLTPMEPIAESALAEVGEIIPPVLELKRGPTIRLV